MLLFLLVQAFCLAFSLFRLFSRSKPIFGIFYFALLVTSIFGSLVPLDILLQLNIRASKYFMSLGDNQYSLFTAQMFAVQSLYRFLY